MPSETIKGKGSRVKPLVNNAKFPVDIEGRQGEVIVDVWLINKHPADNIKQIHDQISNLCKVPAGLAARHQPEKPDAKVGTSKARVQRKRKNHRSHSYGVARNQAKLRKLSSKSRSRSARRSRSHIPDRHDVARKQAKLRKLSSKSRTRSAKQIHSQKSGRLQWIRNKFSEIKNWVSKPQSAQRQHSKHVPQKRNEKRSAKRRKKRSTHKRTPRNRRPMKRHKNLSTRTTKARNKQLSRRKASSKSKTPIMKIAKRKSSQKRSSRAKSRVRNKAISERKSKLRYHKKIKKSKPIRRVRFQIKEHKSRSKLGKKPLVKRNRRPNRSAKFKRTPKKGKQQRRRNAHNRHQQKSKTNKNIPAQNVKFTHKIQRVRKPGKSNIKLSSRNVLRLTRRGIEKGSRKHKGHLPVYFRKKCKGMSIQLKMDKSNMNRKSSTIKKINKKEKLYVIVDVNAYYKK